MLVEVDSVGAQSHCDRGGLDIADAFGVGAQFDANHLAVVGQRHELGVEPRSAGITVDQPQRTEGIVVGQRGTHMFQRSFRTGPQHLDEQVVHRREVVVDQRLFHTGLSGDTAGRRRGIPSSRMIFAVASIRR